MNFFAMTLALAAGCLCTLAAMPVALATSCVDSADCANLNVPATCGMTILGQEVTDVCPVACGVQADCANAIRAARSTKGAQIQTVQGHIVVTSGEQQANLTDMQSRTDAKVLFDEVGTKARRADTTVTELLEELNTGNAAMATSNDNASSKSEAVLGKVVQSLNLIVGEMKSLREDTVKTDKTSQDTAAKVAASLVLIVAEMKNPVAAPCIPYVEFVDPKDKKCKLLRVDCNGVTEWEKVRPTRTSDRGCAKTTTCTLGKTWQSVAPTSKADRVCAKVVGCDAKKFIVLEDPTLLSDAKCTTVAATEATALPSCLRVSQVIRGAKTAHYWIKPSGQSARRTVCDMTTEGGGWTMVIRGKGNQKSCYRTDGDCNYKHLGDSKYALLDGSTAKMSNTWINSMSYSRIRFSGSKKTKGNHYWNGKNAGGCTYRHLTDANGACNCRSSSISMSNKYCGSGHSTHEGVGDWPRGGGCVHSHHHSNWWYIKVGDSCGSGYCHGQGQADCHIQVWVR